MSEFIPGLELNRLYYNEIVKPILKKNYPNLPYSVARIGFGSDVLGFDTERSTDHDWGPRLELFLEKKDYKNLRENIFETLATNLPRKFLGYSVHYSKTDEKGVRVLAESKKDYVNHRIEFYTLESFMEQMLGVNITKELTELDWLALPEQRLLAVTSGAIYHDGLNKLKAMQRKFKYYPRDVWYYLMMRQWEILAEEMPFPGRAAELKDDLGMQLITTNQIRKLMKLCFLQERKYAPYNKWLGVAFTKLKCAQLFLPLFRAALFEKDWAKKERNLIAAYRLVGNLHNSLKITETVEIKVTKFHERPYLMINTEDFANAIKQKISSDNLLRIQPKIGSINQISDETFVLDEITSSKRIIDSLQ